MSETISKYIEKDPVSFIHVKELLTRNYSIIFESDKGFIIHDDDIGFTYMSFNDRDTMINELSKKRYEHYLAYDKEIVDFYNDNDSVKILHQFAYPSTKLFDIEGYDIRILSTDYAPILDSFYKAIGPEEKNIDALKRKDVLGLFENDKLAGIIGKHPEGCVGMLHVFEEFRKKGYGEVLEKAMINKLIKEKKMVFCEVVDGNEISMHLQEKLGYVKGDKKIYWLV